MSTEPAGELRVLQPDLWCPTESTDAFFTGSRAEELGFTGTLIGELLQFVDWDIRPKESLVKLKTVLEEKGFVNRLGPVSIHDELSIKFLESIGAPENVLNILKFGLIIPVSDLDNFYEEPNNVSACKNNEFLEKTLNNWVAQGYIVETDKKPLYVNPLSVVTQHRLIQGDIKLRPVLDQSRNFNRKCKVEKVKLDHLKTVEYLLSKDDYMMSLDLSNCYFHVKLHPSMYPYFGFKMEKGGKNFYYYSTVMFYGTSSAVNVVTNLLRPLKTFFHALFIKYSCYIDDARICHADREACICQFEFCKLVFNLAGWTVNTEKSSKEPEQNLYFLGFYNDSKLLKYFAHPAKLTELNLLISELLDFHHSHPIKAKLVARLLGKIAALTPAFGNIMRILTRSLQHQLGQIVLDSGWDSVFVVSPLARRELHLLLKCLPLFHGQPIQGARRPKCLTLEYDKMLKMINHIKFDDVPLHNLIVSDSSDAMAFIYVNDSISQVTEYEFGEKEIVLPSTYKELLALKMFLVKNEKFLRTKKYEVLFWQCDNLAASHILTKGSRKSVFQELVFDIKKLELKFFVNIVPVWTPRSHHRIQVADLGSKLYLDSDQWSLAPAVLENVCLRLSVRPSVDAFASSANKQFLNFFSELPQEGSLGVDFFAQILDKNTVYYVCPPVRLISRALNFVIDNGLKALFVVPRWPSANFWPILFENCAFRPEISRHLIFKGYFRKINESKQSSFHHFRSQWMLAFLVNLI